jgi:tetratricopeptide (TPR) repeat protein
MWLRHGRLLEAIEILRAAVDTWGHPTYGAQAMITLGIALAGTGDLNGAERQYRTVVDLDHPMLADVARFNLAELVLRRGEVGEAMTLYKAVVAGRHPDMGPRAGLNLGVLYSKLGEWELARNVFSQVLSSGHAEQAELAQRNLLALQQAHRATGDREANDPASRAEGEGVAAGARSAARADEAHDRPGTVTDDPLASALRRGPELEARGDLAGAEECYRVADQLGSGEGASGLGLILFERGAIDAAEAALRRADQRRDPTGTFRLGFLLEETGRAAEALAVYARAATLGSVWAMGNLGNLLRQRGDLDGARAAFAQILASTTDEKELALARQRLACLAGGAHPRPVPPASFDPEASALDSLLWIAGEPNDDRVRRARAFALAQLEPPLRQELAALIDAMDQGAARPAQASIARFVRALLDRS